MLCSAVCIVCCWADAVCELGYYTWVDVTCALECCTWAGGLDECVSVVWTSFVCDSLGIGATVLVD